MPRLLARRCHRRRCDMWHVRLRLAVFSGSTNRYHMVSLAPTGASGAAVEPKPDQRRPSSLYRGPSLELLQPGGVRGAHSEYVLGVLDVPGLPEGRPSLHLNDTGASGQRRGSMLYRGVLLQQWRASCQARPSAWVHCVPAPLQFTCAPRTTRSARSPAWWPPPRAPPASCCCRQPSGRFRMWRRWWVAACTGGAARNGLPPAGRARPRGGNGMSN